ncbi:uncharacterized protein isoform X1 [Choristoneura fumiferana]|uniref:uncharacterized protein isoform X1 n=2 Tax=Choristoneura fumiferana TaxID=7141 RepID=UPI003D15D06E
MSKCECKCHVGVENPRNASITSVSRMERPSELRSGEQHPLLKVDTGAGDVATHQPSSPTVCREIKKILLDRWPEVMTAYWMTLSLLGSAFLICFVLGTNGYKRPPLLIRNNLSKLSGDIFCHHIIPRGGYLPFVFYTQFLSTMADEYRSMRINIIFLVDDSIRSIEPRNMRCYNGWMGYSSRDAFDESNKQDLLEFGKKHPNINITIGCLSKYMAMTPLRYKWRTMPLSYLSFYARIFTVWQNGGIGMDLAAFNNHFGNKLHFDRRINEILKNHNNGLVETDYNTLLSAIDKEEENCLINFSNQIFNETIKMFNKIFSIPTAPAATEPLPVNIPVIRTHRAKRQLSKDDDIEITTRKQSTDQSSQSSASDLKLNGTENYKETTNLELNISTSGQVKTDKMISTLELQKHTATQEGTDLSVNVIQEPFKNDFTTGMNQSDTTDSENHQIVLVYDLALMTDNLGPLKLPPAVSNTKYASNGTDHVNKTKTEARLALHSDGIFVAASEKMHPFLGMLLTASFSRLRPELVIQDTLYTQCTGVYRYETYCNVYLI